MKVVHPKQSRLVRDQAFYSMGGNFTQCPPFSPGDETPVVYCPNHTLPTGGTARYTGGLSVFNFLRIRTWMRVDDKKGSQDAVRDAVQLARLEGLEGHARASECRLEGCTPAGGAFRKR